MKPLYSTIEWPKIATYDLEAERWVDIVLVCHLDEYGNRHHFTSVSKYLDWLFAEFEGDIVFAHAGGHYDHRFLLAEAADKGWEFTANMSGGNIVILTISNGERTLKFGDSYRLMPDALAKIGETIGLPKLDVDPSKMHEMTRQQQLDYCFRDCEIVLKGLQFMRDALMSVGADFAFTLASIATRYVRRSPGIQWDKIVTKEHGKMVVNPKTRLWDGPCYDAFAGGRCEMFMEGLFREETSGPIYWYDIVSSYPTSMREELPLYYKGFFTPPKNMVNVESYLGFCGITQCIVDIPDHYITVLPTRSYDDTNALYWKRKTNDTLLTFQTGEWRGRWTNIELLEAVKHGAKIKAIEGQWRFEGAPFMRNFVDTFYKLRQDAKNRGDTFGSYAYKILLNSAYGKLVETVDRQSFVTRGELERAKRENVQVEATPVAGVFSVRAKEAGPFRHTAAGAYVTAYSRIRLFQKAHDMHKRGATIYYCDTDSLMVSQPMAPEETGKGLGQWEPVDTLSALEIVLPKVYRAESQTGKVVYKCKGCPIVRKFEPEETSEIRWQAFKQYKFDETEELAQILGREGITGFLSDIRAGTLKPRLKQKRCKRCKGAGVVEYLMCSECMGKGFIEGPLVRALRSKDRKREWNGQSSKPFSSKGR